MSHAGAKSFNVHWRPDSVKEQNQSMCEQQMTDLSVSIVTHSFVNPIHVNYEKERKQDALLPETNAHNPTPHGFMEWL